MRAKHSAKQTTLTPLTCDEISCQIFLLPTSQPVCQMEVVDPWGQSIASPGFGINNIETSETPWSFGSLIRLTEHGPSVSIPLTDRKRRIFSLGTSESCFIRLKGKAFKAEHARLSGCLNGEV